MTRLDAVRGLAALCILLGHIHQVFIRRLDLPTVEVATFFSYHPVAIFFILSGFVIIRSILKNIEQNGHFVSVDFALNRIVRIYPPFIAAIAISVVVYGVILWLHLPGSDVPFGLPGDVSAVRGKLVLTSADLLNAFQMKGGMMSLDGPLWSLYVEFNIYIVAMGIAMVLAGKHIVRVLGIAVVIYGAWAGKGANSDFWFYAGIWSIGAALNFIPINNDWMKRIFVGAGAASIIFALISPHVLYSDDAVSRVFLVISCIAYAAFLVADFGSRFHVFGRVAHTAKFSYTLYIVHFPILLLVMAFTQGIIGHSYWQTAFVSAASASIILIIVTRIAPLLENTAFYKSKILGFVGRRSTHIKAAAE